MNPSVNTTATSSPLTLNLRAVPIARIAEGPQPRKSFDPSELSALADSIRTLGLQQPLLCQQRGETYDLLDGGRRLRACRDLLGWKEVSVLVIKSQGTEQDAIARQLVANLQRVDLNPIERALGIEALRRSSGLHSEAIAKLLSLSNASVTRSLSLLTLPDDIRQLVMVGAICADKAYLLSRIEDDTERRRLAAEASSGQLSRDSLARKLKASRRSGERRVAGFTKSVAALGNGRSITLAGPGLTLETMMEWLESLLARARKAKAQGITLETFVRALRDQAKEGKGVPS